MKPIVNAGITFLLSASFLACGGNEVATTEAEIAKNLDKKGTTELLEAADKDQYTPPADGRLTDGQVQMYLKVREHEKKIAKVARTEIEQHSKKAEQSGGDKSLGGMMQGLQALGSVADFLTADIRAAKELGYNTKEYTWIKEQILAASGAAMATQMQKSMTAGVEAQHAEFKKQLDQAKDDATRKMYADMLAGFEQSKQEMAKQQQTQDPALAYNLQLLSKYENTLNALAAELAKFGADEGEAKKSLNVLQNAGQATQTTAAQTGTAPQP